MSNQSPWQSSPALRPKREDEYYQQECGASQQQHRSFGQAPSPMTPLNHGAPTASTTSLYYAHHPSSHQQQQQQQQPQPQHLQQQEQQSPHVLQPSVHAGQQQSGRQDSAYAPTHQAPFLRQHQQLPPQHSAYNHHHGTVTSSPETVHYPMGYADAASGTQQPNISLQPVHGQGLPYQSAHPNLPHSDPTGSHNSQLRQPAYIHYSIQPSQYHELPNHNATPDESVHHHPDLQREVQPHHFQHHFNAERLFASQPLYRYSDTNPTLSSSTSSNLLTLGRPLLPSLNNRLHHGHMPGSMVGAGINDDTSSTRPMQIGVLLSSSSNGHDLNASPEPHAAGPGNEQFVGSSREAGRGRGRGRSRRERTLSRTAMAVSDDPNVRPYACGVPECKIRWKEIVAPDEPETIELANALLAAGWQRPPVEEVPLPMFPSAGALSDHLRGAHPRLLEMHKGQKHDSTSVKSVTSDGEKGKAPVVDPSLPKLFCCGVPKCGKGWSSINGLQYHIQVSGKGKHGHWRTAIPTVSHGRGTVAPTSKLSPALAGSSSQPWNPNTSSPLAAHVANIKDAVESQREHVRKLEAEQPWICPFTEEATGLKAPSSPSIVTSVNSPSHGALAGPSGSSKSVEPSAGPSSLAPNMVNYTRLGASSGWLMQAQNFAAGAGYSNFGDGSGQQGSQSSPLHLQGIGVQGSSASRMPGSQPSPQRQSPVEAAVITAGFSAEDVASVPCRKRFRQRGGLAYHIVHSHRGLAQAALDFMMDYPDVQHSSVRSVSSAASILPAPAPLPSPLVDHMARDPTLKRRIENELRKVSSGCKRDD